MLLTGFVSPREGAKQGFTSYIILFTKATYYLKQSGDKLLEPCQEVATTVPKIASIISLTLKKGPSTLSAYCRAPCMKNEPLWVGSLATIKPSPMAGQWLCGKDPWAQPRIWGYPSQVMTIHAVNHAIKKLLKDKAHSPEIQHIQNTLKIYEWYVCKKWWMS